MHQDKSQIAHQIARSRFIIASELQGPTPPRRLAFNKGKQHSHPVVHHRHHSRARSRLPSTNRLDASPSPANAFSSPNLLMASLNLDSLLLSEIRDKVQAVFGYRPCLWQLKVVRAILKRDKDVASI
jgi:hypothetical protein